MFRILLTIALFLPSLGYGEMYLHVRSHHPAARNLNRRTLGFGVKKGDSIYGIYRNSYNDTSAYLVKQSQSWLGFSFLYGAVTGYPKPVLPVAALHYELGHVALTYTPPTSVSEQAVMVSVRF